jgi:predicted phosphoribosyltransferase
VPFQPELGLGAVGEDGVRVLNRAVIWDAGVSEADLAAIEARERAEVDRRAGRYRGGRARLPLPGQTAVIVDDGIATGSTAMAACRIATALGAARIVLAVPVAPAGWEARIGAEADLLVSVAAPEGFQAISQFYDDFSQTSEDDVIACLAAATSPRVGHHGRSG